MSYSGRTSLKRKPIVEDVYQQHGYADRKAYLESLCEEYDRDKVHALAQLLGPEEDFDGLITGLQDD